jgi:NADH pyrophosphatase NudC (nudix superfamily)
LVFESYDTHKDETFYRLLGGSIEFGEPSEQTMRRELYEEAGLELCDVRYLATTENVFPSSGVEASAGLRLHNGPNGQLKPRL